MIATIKKGGLLGQLNSILLVVCVGFVPVWLLSSYTFANESFNIPWVRYSVPAALVLIQGIWFQRVIHQSRFFEQWSTIPFLIYVVTAFCLPEQFQTWDTLALNFIWLIFYQKLFYQNDEVISNAQVFMDIGILIIVGAFVYPKSIYLLPFLYILLNQFTASNLNKFYIVLLSSFMVAFSTVGIAYFFISPEWVTQLPSQLSVNIDLKSILNAGPFCTYIVLFVVLLLLSPVMYRQLSFMQTKNRTVINMLFFHVLCVVVVAILSGNEVYKSMHLLLLPMAFLTSFGIYHIRKRWLTNLGLLFVVFAVVLIQWVYLKG